MAREYGYMNQTIKPNLHPLKDSTYPGRGIIIGQTPDSKFFVQIYWIMGRSENSRNRIFRVEKQYVKTDIVDSSKLKDPSNILYYPIKFIGNVHIVTNGDQTDTILQSLKNGGSFEDALAARTFEPDEPNYTPRISGLVDLDDDDKGYKLSILKTVSANPRHPLRGFFNYERAIPGIGHCITTYEGDGNPLPSFSGEPFLVELYDEIDYVSNFYWDILNDENKVSLLVKFINIATKETELKIINKYQVGPTSEE